MTSTLERQAAKRRDYKIKNTFSGTHRNLLKGIDFLTDFIKRKTKASDYYFIGCQRF